MKKTKKERKRLFFISAIIIVLMISLFNSVSKDWSKILSNKAKAQELSVKYEELLSNEEKLVSQVTRLQDDDYIARYAKEKYMYSGEGEVIIRLD